jgi:hypothetical protein
MNFEKTYLNIIEAYNIPDSYYDKNDGFLYGGGNVVKFYTGINAISNFHIQNHDKGPLQVGDKLKWVEDGKVCYGVLTDTPVSINSDELVNYNHFTRYYHEPGRQIVRIFKTDQLEKDEISAMCDLINL